MDTRRSWIPALAGAVTAWVSRGAAARREQRWRQLLDACGLGVGEWDLVRERITFSPRWQGWLGFAPDACAVPAQAFWSRVHPQETEPVQHTLATLRQPGTDTCRIECRLRRADGSWGWFELTALVAERRRRGPPRRVVCTARDIDERRVADRHVAASDRRLPAQQDAAPRPSTVDALTRLPNRAQVLQLLQAAIATCDRDGALLTVCTVDVDRLKPLNQRHGRAAGDRLLVELARRLDDSLRTWAGGDDVAGRLGSDEFVLLLRRATLQESRHAVERVLRQIALPADLGLADGPLRVSASIGATVYPHDRCDAEALLRHADHAMHGAKQAGGNAILYFDTELDRLATARFVALGRVQEGLAASEFCLHFQPKVDMRRGSVLGAEALLRWNHPDHGLMPPGQFLPLVEPTALAITLGNWVLAQGIAQLAAWQREGLDLTLSINVSARHLQEPSFVEVLEALLERAGSEVARHLVIEVLETAALADVDYTSTLMQRCRALGVRFALDDFGTGYSTLTYLKRLPLDMLKIDRSFVSQMLEDAQDLAIVEGVIALARRFGCAVVAEGVESVEQAERLIELGCDLGQGNGIAAAMPAGQLPQWVRGFVGMSPAQPA